MFSLKELEQSTELVHQYLLPTPQYNWPQLCRETGCDLWVKHENHTPTTAFKVRGGLVLLNYLSGLAQKPRGIISATVGNHGQSLAYAGQKLAMPVTIVVPEGNNEDQNRAIKGLGANLVIFGQDFEAARQHSLQLQGECGYRAIAPFERELVLGVASYALEYFSAVQDLDTVYVPVGMGSGISGLIKTRDLLGLSTKIVGVVSEGAPTFALSFAAGRVMPTDSVNTIADGVATRSPIQAAFDIIKAGADRIVTVSDDEIASAMYQYYQKTHNLAEPAAATPLAALIKEKQQMKGKKVGVILTGGNIDFERFVKYAGPFCGNM
ncbi:threonine dehydratase [Thalassomonas haliotis]|uniref:Threonine dehydratase n=1 Tax=Thalassomonas haliotis TaxID=485448 RepID=A0ABY7V8P1_9GAMM|nr:threonine dehydratase [Thalassomonas haliotis]WDE09962.1 threonine dehydratase [Thalassomonas haliotis]